MTSSALNSIALLSPEEIVQIGERDAEQFVNAKAGQETEFPEKERGFP